MKEIDTGDTVFHEPTVEYFTCDSCGKIMEIDEIIYLGGQQGVKCPYCDSYRITYLKVMEED